MSGGTSNPDLFDVIAALPETQYNIIIMPYSDAANLTILETELKDRFGPIRQNDGVAFLAKRDTMAGLTTLGESRNSSHVSILGMSGPSSPWEWAGAVAGQVALSAQQDPARPFQTLELSGILPPSEKEQFLLEERNMLLYDGVSTYRVDSGGIVRIERLITTYKTNAFGSSDTSLLDVNSLLTLSYLRYDLRTHLLNRFPNFKLADDGTRFGPGQAIVTPKIAKSEVMAKARQWEERGLVENVDQLKRDLLVERDAANPNQLNILVSPDLINQLVTTAAQIGFLL
jgi:phage tail sheath gpL-like